MRAVVQRVSSAEVVVENACAGEIGPGVLIYLAVDGADQDRDLTYLADKVRYLRIFEDDAGVGTCLTGRGGTAQRMGLWPSSYKYTEALYAPCSRIASTSMRSPWVILGWRSS